LKRIALLRLVAVILGVKFDDLRQRDHERDRRQRLTWAALAAALVLLIGGGAAGYWAVMRPATTHYRQLIWRWGVPEGLGPIDDETRRHLETNYNVVMQRASVTQPARVVEVRREGSGGALKGYPGGDEREQARWVVHYDRTRRAERIEIFDGADRLLREDLFERLTSTRNKLVVRFKRGTADLAQAATQKLTSDLLSGQQADEARSDITQNELTFDDNGFVTERHFQNNHGDPRRNAQESFGEHNLYSSSGLMIRRTEIGPNNNEITLRNGVRAVTFNYDENYNLVGSTFSGTDDVPIDGPDGYASFVRKYDSWGNDIETTYLGVDGKPTLHTNGHANVTNSYDARGNNTEVAFSDVIGRPVVHKDGVAKFVLAYDERGREVERAFFDVDNKPTLMTLGYARLEQVLDEHGNLKEARYFGVDGRPAISRDGFARLTRNYDARGNVIEERYFDEQNRPTISKNGYAEFRSTFDDRGNLTEHAFFGVDGEPTYNTRGFAKVKYTHDRRELGGIRLLRRR
jgi:hypothetical protein